MISSNFPAFIISLIARKYSVYAALKAAEHTLALRPAKHPVQPTLTEAISAVREIMDQTHCHFIYLTTEDQQLLDGMKEEFKDSLLYCDVPRYSGKIDRRLNEIRYNEADSYKSKGINYIVPVGVLAKCNYLFAGRTSGSVAVLLMDNCFEGVTVWNNGEYE
jgi:hypothetical protein